MRNLSSIYRLIHGIPKNDQLTYMLHCLIIIQELDEDIDSKYIKIYIP